MINWNGRRYRPAGIRRIPVNPDKKNLLKPLGQKGEPILVQQFIGGVKETGPAPSPSPTPTPSPSGGIAPTPTPTITSTVTPTPTITPTPTLTPTPSPFVASVSIAPTGTTKYNFISLTGSTNISSPTYVWTLSDFYDYSGNTITSHTGQTTPIGEFRNTGTTLVDLTVTGLDTYGNPVTGSSTTFEVIVPTTYRMFLQQIGGTNLYYTDDMITYSSTTLPNSTGGGVVGSVAYSPVLDIYVTSGEDRAFYSYDNINWSSNTLPSLTRMGKILWVPELQKFASAGERTSAFVMSSDGINWTDSGAAWGDIGTQSFAWDDVNNAFFVSDASGNVYKSSDGLTWSLIYSAGITRFSGVFAYEGRVSLVDTLNQTIEYSDDAGLTWSAGTYNTLYPSGFVTFGSVITSSGRRITAGNSSGGWGYSDDGITFNEITIPTGLTDNAIGSTYNETEDKIIFSSNMPLFVSSDNGLTYTTQARPASLDFRITGIRYNIT